MKYQVEIEIMPLDEILDPQGKVVERSLKNLDINGASGVRVGKHVSFLLEADSTETAQEKVEAACKKLLANLIVEKYDYQITEI